MLPDIHGMQEMSTKRLYTCDLCRRSVDGDIRDRARDAWQPLIICEPCVLSADVLRATPRPAFAAAAS